MSEALCNVLTYQLSEARFPLRRPTSHNATTTKHKHHQQHKKQTNKTTPNNKTQQNLNHQPSTLNCKKLKSQTVKQNKH